MRKPYSLALTNPTFFEVENRFTRHCRRTPRTVRQARALLTAGAAQGAKLPEMIADANDDSTSYANFPSSAHNFTDHQLLMPTPLREYPDVTPNFQPT